MCVCGCCCISVCMYVCVCVAPNVCLDALPPVCVYEWLLSVCVAASVCVCVLPPICLCVCVYVLAQNLCRHTLFPIIACLFPIPKQFTRFYKLPLLPLGIFASMMHTVCVLLLCVVCAVCVCRYHVVLTCPHSQVHSSAHVTL